MCDEHVEAEEQNQHSRTVLQIPIQLANHSSQPQEPNNFKSAEKAADALKERQLEDLVLWKFITYLRLGNWEMLRTFMQIYI